MALSLRSFGGLFRLKFVPRQSFRCAVEKDGISRGYKQNIGMVERVRLVASGHFLKRLSCGQTMKVTAQFSRPMSQFSKEDSDIQRMRRGYEQSGQQHMKGDGEMSRLIYEVRGLGMMRFCTLFFYATALVGLYMSPDIISSALEHEAVNGETVQSLLSIAFAVVVLPVLLTIFNRRLVLRMYYSEAQRSYVAVTQTAALTLQRAEFGQSDVVPTITKPGAFLHFFKLNSLTAKGRPYFVNPYNFKLPSDYNHLMGYQ